MRIHHILFFLFMATLVSTQSTIAQTVCWPSGDTLISVETCNALFYDSGGPDGNIASVDPNSSNNPKYVTFSAASGAHIQCEFTQFSVNGVLQIWDGQYSDPSKRLIGQFCTSTLDASTGNKPPVFFSTGNALTFVYFGANGDMQKPGWAATISCVSDLVPTSNDSPFLGISNAPLGAYANIPDPHTIQLDTLNPSVVIRANVKTTGLYTNDYYVTQIPYNEANMLFAYNEGQPIGASTDDNWLSEVQLPFTFTFFGKPYTKVYPGANGLISMNPQSGQCSYSYNQPPASPPYSAIPYVYKNCVYGVYEDIDCRYYIDKNDGLGMGNVRVGVLGSPPCRAFVFNYLNVGLYGHSSPNHTQPINYNTYQMVLYEGTNIIDVYVKHRKCCATTNSHGEGIIGLQNSTSSQILLAPGRGMTGWTTDNEAWRFTPVTPPDPDAEVTWYADSVDPATLFGHDPTITVQPQTNTRYISEYRCKNASGETFVLRDTILVLCPVIDTTGVTDSTDVIDSTGVKARDRNFEVWPNPTHDAVYVKWTATTSMPTSIEVLDLQGRLLFSVPAETTTRVDLSPLPAGTYLLKSGNATTKVVRK